MPSKMNHIALQVVTPEPAQRGGAVEVRPIIDGEDILATAFDEGPAEDPRHLLSPSSPLMPSLEPKEVRLAEADCTEGCCGAVFVTITREDATVVWHGWRNPDDDELDLPAYRFDARQYEAEVQRAVADHSWEWPARTIARLLEEGLRQQTRWLDRWECELAWASALPWERDRVTVVFFFQPGEPTSRDERPWLQFRIALSVTDDAPVAQADRMLQELLSQDPRAIGHVCGGSREFAGQLGYPWPERFPA
ncbi:hypothetical protein AB5J55_31465 [Streptomyces sp. R11]|uniref:Uncharacterized protein n=1 Tax=Streptomyces sp. R11 TaxID=3238625 RepID=A0AB39N5N7_9ACTN